jgi:hypothetical protein
LNSEVKRAHKNINWSIKNLSISFSQSLTFVPEEKKKKATALHFEKIKITLDVARIWMENPEGLWSRWSGCCEQLTFPKIPTGLALCFFLAKARERAKRKRLV